jgi:hypothetical protein
MKRGALRLHLFFLYHFPTAIIMVELSTRATVFMAGDTFRGGAEGDLLC